MSVRLRVVAYRPMDQVEIDVINTELLQSGIETFLNALVEGVRDFARDLPNRARLVHLQRSYIAIHQAHGYPLRHIPRCNTPCQTPRHYRVRLHGTIDSPYQAQSRCFYLFFNTRATALTHGVQDSVVGGSAGPRKTQRRVQFDRGSHPISQGHPPRKGWAVGVPHS
jgi:hypothetical protein